MENRDKHDNLHHFVAAKDIKRGQAVFINSQGKIEPYDDPAFLEKILSGVLFSLQREKHSDGPDIK